MEENWPADRSRGLSGGQVRRGQSLSARTCGRAIRARLTYAGRAVIATDVGGVRNILEDAEESRPIPRGGFCATTRGILIRSGDSDGLAAALVEVAENQRLRAQLGQAARAYVLSHFNQDRLCRDIETLYTDLLSQGPS